MKQPSFSARTREELCTLPLTQGEAALAELYGVFLFCNQFRSSGLRVVTESPAFAARLSSLLQQAFGLSFDRQPEPPYTGRSIFALWEEEKLRTLLEGFGYDSQRLISVHVNFALLEQNDHRLAFLRGAFLAGGSVTDPAKRYHMELSTAHASVSRELLSVLEESGFHGKTAVRKGNHIVYFKQSAEIAQLLEALGAPGAAAAVLTAKEQKITINKANRRSNCDLANVDKSVAAATEQLLAIRQLERARGLENLPLRLQEAAQLRLEYPELNLTQLGAMCDPPVTKSTFNYRLKKLLALSQGKTV